MGGEGAIKHRVGSHWVMVSKWLGLVGMRVGDMVEDERRRSMRWASDCHHQLPLWRHLAYDIFHEEGMGELIGGDIGCDNISICFWAEGLKEHQNRSVFAMIVGFWIVLTLTMDRESLSEGGVGGVMVLGCVDGHGGDLRA
jgi:hypothetical protein